MGLVAVPLPTHRGLPTGQVIPDGWAARHATVVEDTFDCTVTIGPAGGAPVFDPATRVSASPAVAAVYTGSASIGLASVGGASEDRRVEAAEDQVDLRAYVLKLPPLAAGVDDVEVDHVVVVTNAPSAALTGTRLLVTGVATPGREFSRVISARTYT